MKFNSNKKGFTLIELLIYTAILIGIIGGIVTIFVVTSKISNRETSSVEVASQLNYVSQTIQRLVRESSVIDIPANISTSTLKLRTSSLSTDPTCIYLSNGTIKISQGSYPSGSENCSSTSTDLTNPKVIVDNLSFTKLISYPGHDTVAFEIQMSLNTSSTENRATKVLKSSIARVSAATFDSSLLPGSSNTYDVGQGGSYWRRIILGNGSAGSPAYSFNDDLDMGLFRPTTDILGFSTAGVERMRIDSNGNVGIGTQSPNSSKGSNGYLDARDIWLRDVSKWASEVGGVPFLGNFASGGYSNAGVTIISTTCTAGSLYTIYDTSRNVYDLCICRQTNKLACFPG